jgi:hypothetical protein
MSIEQLIKILTPPGTPVFVPTEADWLAVEAEVGTALPIDYKHFISTFGPVYIDQFLYIYDPFVKNQYLNFIKASKVQSDVLRELRDDWQEEIPYPIFSESGGLLACGRDDNGNSVFWRTIGTPDQWTIVVNEGRAPEYEEFPIGLTQFLRGILTKEIRCRIYPRGFPSGQPRAYEVREEK